MSFSVDLPTLLPEYPIIEYGTNLLNLPREALRLIGEAPESRTDRIQVRREDDRFSLVVRHNEEGHLNGYVWMDSDKWKSLSQHAERRVRAKASESVTFVGFSTAHVVWCRPTQKGRLSVPTVLHLTKPDFWIGFDTYMEYRIRPDARHPDAEEVLTRLIAFEHTLLGALRHEGISV